MAEERISLSIRMSKDLLDRLQEAVRNQPQSMNAEIVKRLEWSFGTMSNNGPSATSDSDEEMLIYALGTARADFIKLMRANRTGLDPVVRNLLEEETIRIEAFMNAVDIRLRDIRKQSTY